MGEEQGQSPQLPPCIYVLKQSNILPSKLNFLYCREARGDESGFFSTTGTDSPRKRGHGSQRQDAAETPLSHPG